MEQVQRHVDRTRFLSAVSDVVTIVRGPKPAAALRDFGIEPRHCTGEPHTWREILQVVNRAVPLANQTVGLPVTGQPNASLLAGLEARGATVINLRLYHWELPEDTSSRCLPCDHLMARSEQHDVRFAVGNVTQQGKQRRPCLQAAPNDTTAN